MRICERIACRKALFVHDGRHLWFNTYTPSDEASRTHHAQPRTKPTPHPSPLDHIWTPRFRRSYSRTHHVFLT
jgi:hypothetical protein